ncbi:hypothetical protein B0H19DRAFT_890423, partial [Mycena capillaripes]
LPSDIPAGDFFSCVHAHMNVDPATANLGWKELSERHKDPYHRLSTDKDLRDALKVLVDLMKSTRRKKAVVMELVNLQVQPDGQTTKQAEKESETAVTSVELRKLQAKLACALHPSKNRWCHVMGPESKFPGKHVLLGIEHVMLWARKMHDGEADEECITPPNVLNLDELTKKGHQRHERGSNRSQPTLPPIHVHVGGASDHVLRDANTNTPKRVRKVSSDEDSDDNEDPLRILDVLGALHDKFPDLNYMQYTEPLCAKGIVYASS